MDQQISMRKIFNYCFSSSRLRAKSRDKDHSEGSYISNSNRNEPGSEHKTVTKEKSSLHKLMAKNNTNFTNSSFNTDYETTDKRKTERKLLFSRFKTKSLKEETIVTIKKKQDSDIILQRGYKRDKSTEKEKSLCSKPSLVQTLEAKASKHYSHDSVIELMSKDGTLKLYSATTLTPLSSVGVDDEDRIQTHLSISCFRPEEHLQGYSSEGSDDVFEKGEEASNSLAFNFENLGIEHCKKVSGSSNSGTHKNKKHRTTSFKSGHPVKDECLSLICNGVEERIQDFIPENGENEEKLVPFATHCLRPETQHNISSCSNVKRHSYNHPQTNEEPYQIPSNVPLTRSLYQNPDSGAHSVHCCASLTNHISPVKRWILQLYFNSLVDNDENIYGYRNINRYPEGTDSRCSSPHFPYAHQNNSTTFNQTAPEEQHLPETFAGDSSEIYYNADFHTYQSRMSPTLISKNSLKSGKKNSESRKMKMERRKYQAATDNKSKEIDGDFYMQKENIFRTKSTPTAETSRKRIRRPFREKFWNSKPPVFSQDATYTYYSFIDGPLAKNSGESNPNW